MARALFFAALAIAASSVPMLSEARTSLWAKSRDKVNINTAGSSDYIASLQKLKHLCVEHHSLVPPHIRTTTGAFNLHDSKIFNDQPVDLGQTSLLTEDVPFWTFQGSAVVTDDYVRLTPNRQSQQGGLWNLEPLDLPSFELRVGIRIHSRANVGADGMAIWIIDDIPTTFGPTFGLPVKFHGLGILVDTYDNDANRDNPVISLVYNSERDKSMGRDLSVADDYKNDVLGRCTVDFRNQADVTVLILKYRAPIGQHDAGSIELSVEKPGRHGAETSCVTVAANQAPLAIGDRSKKYFLGATAETGGMSDNHDVAFVAVLPLAGVEYERDIDALNHEDREIRGEERAGERMHRFTHKKDKEDRTYWRAKTKEEEEQERALDEAMRKRKEEVDRLTEERNRQQQEQQQEQQPQQEDADQGYNSEPVYDQQQPEQDQYQDQYVQEDQQYVPEVPEQQQQQYVPQRQGSVSQGRPLQQQQQRIPQQQQRVPQQQQQQPRGQQQQRIIPQQQRSPHQQQRQAQQQIPQQQQRPPQQRPPQGQQQFRGPQQPPQQDQYN